MSDEEAPKWSWTRMIYNLPPDKGEIPYTKIGTQPDSPDKPDWRGVIKNKVIELPMPDEYKFKYNDPKYFFFDTPDHADPFKKLWWSAKFFTKTGFFIGFLWYGTMMQRKFTLANNVEMMRKIVIPWFFSGVAGSTAVVTAANLRGKKDDYYNYAIGGTVFASIMGRKSYISWVRWMVMGIPAAIIFKYNAEINGHLYPMFNFRHTTWSFYGNSADNGIASGDLRFGLSTNYGDPGRDTRKNY